MAELGANVNAETDDGMSPLHAAELYGRANEALFRVLVELGANVNAKTNDGQTPLHTAVINGRTDAVRVLVKALGADVNMRTVAGGTAINFEDTALHFAAVKGDVGTVRVLVRELGADISIVKTDGWSPI